LFLGLNFLSFSILSIFFINFIYYHYFLIIIPFLTSALTFFNPKRKNYFFKYVFFIFLGSFIFISYFSINTFYEIIETRKGNCPPHYGIPLEYKLNLTKKIKNLLKNKKMKKTFISSSITSISTLKFEEIFLLKKYKVNFSTTYLKNTPFLLIINKFEHNVKKIEKLLKKTCINCEPYYIYVINSKDLNSELINCINNNNYLNYILNDLNKRKNAELIKKFSAKNIIQTKK
jgi:hypothetical protein